MRKINSNKSFIKKLSLLLVSLSFVFSSVIFLEAGDSWPLNMGTAQPHIVGYRAVSMLNWSPETDPYAELLRSRVPLQERNQANPDTQINPKLHDKAEILLMQSDYGNSFFNSTALNNTYAENAFQFWQYTDYWSPWHGAATAEVPESLYDAATSDWRARGFEFGFLNLPMPSYTDAAHRNGVKSIAILYVDQAFRPGQTVNEFFIKGADDRYIIADKMVEMANYYGFDGWFINAEEHGRDVDWDNFCNQLREGGMYVNHYDTNSSFNDNKAALLNHSDSVFVNYGWTWAVEDHINYALENGYDPYKQVFIGVEANQGGFNASHSSTNVELLYDADKNPRTSLALFTPSDMYQRGDDFNKLAERIGNSSSETPVYQLPQFQWMIEERERMYFSGVKSDPTETGRQAEFSRPEVMVEDASGWVGVADFVPARSVINGSEFYSDFNTGKGRQYYSEGEVSRDQLWTNMSLQSILPSWQWWVESQGNKLNIDFDYGPNDVRYNIDNSPIVLAYDQQGAYNGGSSLVIYGKLDENNLIHLFKSNLSVNDNSKLNITYKKVSSDNVKLYLSLIMQDNPSVAERIELPNSEQNGEWVTSSLDLSHLSGRNIAAIDFETEGQSDFYQVNLGRISLDSTAQAPQKPSGFKLDKAYHDGQLHLSWDMEDFATVDMYEVYGTDSSGRRVHLGGNYNENLYVKNLEKLSGDIQLELYAVAKNGLKSEASVIDFNRSSAVQNINVKEILRANKVVMNDEAGKVNLTWDAPQVPVDSYKIKVDALYVPANQEEETSFEFTIPADQNEASLDIPLKEGYRYDLSIESIVNGSVVASSYYRGRLYDAYAAPYTIEELSLEEETKLYMRSPLVEDWDRIEVYFEDFTNPLGVYERGKTDFPNKNPINLANNTGLLKVRLKDYSDNYAEDLLLRVANGELVELTEIIDETDFPDPVLLETVKEQVGKYREGLDIYNGNLDLTGLDVKDLSGLDKLILMKEISFGDNESLESIENLPASLEKVYIARVPELRSLDLSALSLETLDIEDVSSFDKLKYFNISENKLDLLEGTNERTILDSAKDIVNGNLNATEVLSDNFIFDRQRPVAYNDLDDLSAEYNLNKETNKTYDVLSLLTGDKTIRDNKFMDLANLEIDGINPIDPEYVLSENLSDYSQYSAKITDSSTFAANNPISLSDDETYIVNFFDPEGTHIAEVKIIVGEGRDLQENLALNANVVATSSPFENLSLMFDGKEDTQVEQSGVPYWIVFDIGEGALARKWAIYHDRAYNFCHAVDAKLQVLKASPSSEDLQDQTFLANDDNWETVAEYNGNREYMLSGDLDNLSARYYRYKITEERWGFYLAEVQILGNRDTSQAASFEAQVEDIVIKEGETYDLLDALVNKDAPEIVSVVDITETGTVNTAVEGKYLGVLKLSFEDGSEKELEVNIIVKSPLEADKSILTQLIDKAENVHKGNYSADSYDNLAKALQKAKDIYQSKNSTLVEVEQATNELASALSALELQLSEENIALKKDILSYNAYEGEQENNNIIAGEKVNNAIDGDTKSKWCPGEITDNAWFVIDLGKEYILTSAKMHNAFPYEAWNFSKGINIKAAELQILDLDKGIDPASLSDVNVASDDANWITVASFENNEEDVAEFVMLDSSSEAKARYVRVNISDAGSGGDYGQAIRLHEFELFGREFSETDKSALQAKYDALNNLDENDYSEESFQKLSEALDLAKGVLDNVQALQEDIEDSLMKLEVAELMLEKMYIVEFDLAYDNLYLAEQRVPYNTVLADIIPTTVPSRDGYKFVQWLKGGEALNGDEQVQDNMVLLAEWEKLVDFTELEAAIKKAEALIEDDYSAETWNNLENALENAKDMLQSANADQESVDAELVALNEAIDSLQRLYPLTLSADSSIQLEAVLETEKLYDRELFLKIELRDNSELSVADHDVLELYDISIVDERGNKVEDVDTQNIKIFLRPTLNDLDTIKLVHEGSTGIEFLNFEIINNERIVFVGSEFSYYGLVKESEEEYEKPSNTDATAPSTQDQEVDGSETTDDTSNSYVTEPTEGSENTEATDKIDGTSETNDSDKSTETSAVEESKATEESSSTSEKEDVSKTAEVISLIRGFAIISLLGLAALMLLLRKRQLEQD